MLLVSGLAALLVLGLWTSDENGNSTGEKKLIVPAGNRYGIRYEQLLAFIIAAL